MPTESEVKKLGPFVRGLSGFVFLMVLMASAGLFVAAITEPFHPLLIVGIAVISLMVHISGRVAIKGYAPTYLLWAHEKK